MRLKTPKTFDEKTFSKLIDEVSDRIDILNFNDLSNSQILNFIVPALSTLLVNHNLKLIPSYWITLRRQLNTGSICEGTTWTNEKVSFRNSNTSPVTMTICLFK